MTRVMLARLGLLIGAFLSLPALRLWMNGDLDATTAIVRAGIGFAVGLAGMAALGVLFSAYAPKSSARADDHLTDITDAEIVEPTPLEGPTPDAAS